MLWRLTKSIPTQGIFSALCYNEVEFSQNLRHDVIMSRRAMLVLSKGRTVAYSFRATSVVSS